MRGCPGSLLGLPSGACGTGKGNSMDYKLRPKPAHKHKEWYTQRNKEVCVDRRGGMTWRALGEKYDLSETYLREVVDSIKFKGV